MMKENIWNIDIDSYLRIKTESRKLTLYPRLLELIDQYKPDRILDYGCGDGEFVYLLLDRRNIRTGIYDNSKLALQIANNKLTSFGVDVYNMVNDIPKNHFDLVIFSLVLMTISSEEEINIALTNIVNAKKKDGIVLIAVTHPCFRQYKYSTFYTDYTEEKPFYYLNEGDKFLVHIHDPLTNDEISFHDYHWSLSKTANLIAKNNMVIKNIYELSDYNSEGAYFSNNFFPPYLILVCC